MQHHQIFEIHVSVRDTVYRGYHPEGAPRASKRLESTENICPQQSRSRGKNAPASTVSLATLHVRFRAVISTKYGIALDYDTAHKCFRSEAQGPADTEAQDAIMKKGKSLLYSQIFGSTAPKVSLSYLLTALVRNRPQDSCLHT
jgi:hypothetical protein